METKVVKNYVDYSLGFPIKMGPVTFIKIHDDWAAKIDYNKHQIRVLHLLAQIARPLRGSELAFVRAYYRMTLQAFADQFGVSHVAVHKWEKRGPKPTGMAWSTEKDIRLYIQSRLNQDPKALAALYNDLTQNPIPSRKPLPKGKEMVTV